MRLLRALLVLLLVGRRRHAQREDEPSAPEADPTRRDLGAGRAAETRVAALLLGTAACALAFVVLYVVYDSTQLLGLSAGLALALLAAALILAGKQVVPQETAVEPRPDLVMPEPEEEVPELVREGGQGVSRRKLLGRAAGAAGVGLGAAAVVPLASLGPNVGQKIDHTPWRRGRAVVDESGKPISADDVTVGAFVTGFPAGADPRELGSPIVMVKLPPETLKLPAGRRPEEWAPEGILAYSKICTHAGCAIALYRYPLYAPNTPRPALVCPCHYSTFDPARGAERIFGPAGRALPQLPLQIGSGRALLAAGEFSGSIGPAWWSVKGGRS